MKSAAPTERQRTRAETAHLVAFGVGVAGYAVDIMRIKEVIHPVPVTPVPKAPSFIEGVIELRGAILPVIDVRKRFELSCGEPTRASKYLVVSVDVGAVRLIVALLVDRVFEPLRVPKSEIRSAPPLSAGERPFFTGVVQHHGQMLMVLDLDALLSSGEKQLLSGMGATHD